MRDPYLVCAYSNTTLVLTRSVSQFKQCEVVSVKPPGGGRFDIASATCR
jgi:hypothetical protein